jgi:hypothetical protein
MLGNRYIVGLAVVKGAVWVMSGALDLANFPPPKHCRGKVNPNFPNRVVLFADENHGAERQN